jgi:hypothetical protein
MFCKDKIFTSFLFSTHESGAIHENIIFKPPFQLGTSQGKKRGSH